MIIYSRECNYNADLERVGLIPFDRADKVAHDSAKSGKIVGVKFTPHGIELLAERKRPFWRSV